MSNELHRKLQTIATEILKPGPLGYEVNDEELLFLALLDIAEQLRLTRVNARAE